MTTFEYRGTVFVPRFFYSDERGRVKILMQSELKSEQKNLFHYYMITYHLITLFPESTESYLNASILKRAQEKGLITIKYYNPRDFTVASKKGQLQTYSDLRVDNRPYGGGPGMVIEALPVIKAIDKAIGRKIRSNTGKKKIKIVFFSPSGLQFNNAIADKFKVFTDIVFICGRYEGIDARVKKAFPMVEISIGPYVVTGGELAAMIMIDTITRRIPGVLGDMTSIEEERIASPDVYTRPEVIVFRGKKLKVPKILLSGHHAKQEEWRKGRKNNSGTHL